MVRKSFQISILFILLLSCASNPIKRAPERFGSKSDIGLIAGTISIIDDGPKYSEYEIYFRDIISDRVRQHKIKIIPNRVTSVLKPDYRIKDTLVFQYILEHIPGDYEFTNYSLNINAGVLSRKNSSKADFSIPFKVVKGEISYLGDLLLIPKKNELGYQFEWLSNFKREYKKFRIKFPKIGWYTMIDRTPVEGNFKSLPDIEFREENK